MYLKETVQVVSLVSSYCYYKQRQIAKWHFEAKHPDWKDWKNKHKINYETREEEKQRRSSFLRNRAYIAFFNLMQGGRCVLEINDSADKDIKTHMQKWSTNFDINKVSIINKNSRDHPINKDIDQDDFRAQEFEMPSGDIKIPKRFDWREMGAVTPVKDQGNYGACWAFTAIGAIEAQLFKSTGKLVSLSEQDMVDGVSKRVTTTSANSPWRAFKYARDSGGVRTEANCPYLGYKRENEKERCLTYPKVPGTKVKGFVRLKRGDHKALEAAVATVGPVCVRILIYRAFFFYKKGIFYTPWWQFSAPFSTHAVLIVGYGVDEATGQEYWIVKNSWGEQWGEGGYFKLRKRGSGLTSFLGDGCGATDYAQYPILEEE